MNDLTGKTIANRYRIVSFIGSGSLGDVFKVWDIQRAMFLAMRVLNADLVKDKAAFQRFGHDAESLTTLQHPHIVRFYGLAQEDGLTFILMEIVEGISLRDQIFNAGDPFTADQVMQIMRPVCSALHYAHQGGIVHGGLKPANIVIKPTGEIILADFGIARMLETNTTVTKDDSGISAYMAPEQSLGKSPTPQTDIYALGLVLYEMLTAGEPPVTGEAPNFEGKVSNKIRWEQVGLAPLTPGKFNPRMTRDLETVVLKCLEKEPAQRYANTLELLEAVASALGSLPDNQAITTSKENTVKPIVNGTKPNRKQNYHPIAQRKRSPVNLWIIFGVMDGLVVIGAIISFFYIRSHYLLIPENISTLTTSAPASTTLPTSALASAPLPPATQTPTVAIAPTALPVYIQDSSGTSMQLVPEGKFTMGSDASVESSPAHEVFLNNYYIDQSEVTNSQYVNCVNSGSCKPPFRNTQHILFCASVTMDLRNCTDSPNLDYYPMEANSPVIFVDWNMAQTYCQWRGASLPTEAEWEKAARGTDGRTYPWGEGIDCTRANYAGCYSQKLIYPKGPNLVPYFSVEARLSRVEKYPLGVSPYGLYDMAGNVWEWVADWYDHNYYKISPPDDPQGPAHGTQRVYRGGAYMLDANVQASTYRNSGEPTMYTYNIGFRCAHNSTP